MTSDLHALQSIAFIQKHGFTLEQAAATRQIASDAHNRGEEPPTSLPASNAMRFGGEAFGRLSLEYFWTVSDAGDSFV